MATNKSLHLANKAKKDEFYTQLDDISNELRHYKEHFKGKVVFCNCDDPYESNFFKFFVLNFNSWQIKRLICTCYNGSPMAGRELSLFEEQQQKTKPAYKMIVDKVEDMNNDGAVDLADVKLLIKQGNIITKLQDNGDFRSKECIELLQQSDIVVTNPPFSLFREYVAQLIRYDKKFLIIGHQNAITYKEIFPLIKDNKLWLGYGFKGGAGFFINSHYVDYAVASSHKEGMIRVSGVTWYTNLEHQKRHEEIILYKHYTPEEYPTYDNYDAINVDKTAEIPMDYNGYMGVPITFMDKYNPEQFEIIWTTDRGGDGMLEHIKLPHTRYDAPVIKQRGVYKRIIIRRKK